MASEPVSLEFLGEQIKRVQADIRDLKGRVLLVESDQSEFRRDLARLEGKVDALAERSDDRFDQVVELINSTFRTLKADIDELKQRP
jgi:septal ring factor EnvC (AmiA/AmiB activator)